MVVTLLTVAQWTSSVLVILEVCILPLRYSLLISLVSAILKPSDPFSPFSPFLSLPRSHIHLLPSQPQHPALQPGPQPPAIHQ